MPLLHELSLLNLIDVINLYQSECTFYYFHINIEIVILLFSH